MQRFWDVIAVGVLTFVVTAIILVIKPGYTPVQVSDEVRANPNAPVETFVEEEGLPIDEEATTEPAEPLETDEAPAEQADTDALIEATEEAEALEQADDTTEATTEATADSPEGEG